METHIGLDGVSIPVYEWSEAGPYWIHPPLVINTQASSSTDVKLKKEKDGKDYTVTAEMGKAGAYPLPPTTSSIMTKTHCGSRCVFCPPSRYLETSTSFLKECLSGARRVAVVPRQSDIAANSNTTASTAKGKKIEGNKKPQYEKKFVTYHPSVVEKAVHLIRNPFDNLVSRFHHEQKEHKKLVKKMIDSGRRDKQGLSAAQWSERYTNDVTGFKQWCSDEDKLFTAEERATDWTQFNYPKDITRYFEGVSCHAEFFRYVSWHILSIKSIALLDIPVLNVYYEDYSTDLNGSTDKMLRFLHLDRSKSKLPYFDSNKDYSEYFTQEERASASDLMRRLVNARDSTGKGIELLERYWVHEFDVDELRSETKDIV